MSWTDERIERLREMWTLGKTASHIAEELGGVSRNAVIGKAHRLGLQARPSPVKPNEPAPKAAKAKPRAEAPAEPAPAAAAAEPPRRAGRRSRSMPERNPRPTPRRSGRASAPPARRPARASGPFDRPGRLRPPGPERPAGADPAGAAAPPGPRQAKPRGRQQDRPARSERKGLQMADRPSGRTRFPFLRAAVEPGLPLLRRPLRRRLSGPAPPPRPQTPAPAPLRRAASEVKRSRRCVSRSEAHTDGARRPTGPRSGA